MAQKSNFALVFLLAISLAITNARPQVDPFGGTTTTTASPRYVDCINNCQTTPQFSPVCGNDDITYYNEFKLQCAQRCGNAVAMSHLGSCRPTAGGK